MLNGLTESNIKNVLDNQFNDEFWMEYRTGNILNESDLDFIVHQANCFHAMTGGIALALSEKWPIVDEVDRKQSIYGDPDKLGRFTIATVEHPVKLNGIITNKEIKVVNLYSQYHPGPAENEMEKEKSLYYIKTGLTDLRDNILELAYSSIIKDRKYFIGIPWMIGCGIYGMNVNDVYETIREVFYGFEDVIKIVFVDFK